MTVKQEPALAEVLLRPLVEAALTEDLGRRGDVTSQATIPAHMQAQLQIKARQAGVICGMDLARLSFDLTRYAAAAGAIIAWDWMMRF